MPHVALHSRLVPSDPHSLPPPVAPSAPQLPIGQPLLPPAAPLAGPAPPVPAPPSSSRSYDDVLQEFRRWLARKPLNMAELPELLRRLRSAFMPPQPLEPPWWPSTEPWPATLPPQGARPGRPSSAMINEPATIFGDLSGQPLLRLGEGGAQEMVNVSPLSEPGVDSEPWLRPGQRRAKDQWLFPGKPPGIPYTSSPFGWPIPGLQAGGTIIIRPYEQIGGTDYLNEDERYYFLSEQRRRGGQLGQDALNFLNTYQPRYTQPGSYGEPAPAAAAPAAAPNPAAAQSQAQQENLAARERQLAAERATLGPATALTAAQRAGYAAQEVGLAAERGRVAAERGTLGPAAGVITAKGAGFGARERGVAAERAYLAEQERANAARRQEEEGIRAARGNVADITAVARAQRVRDVELYRFDIAGLPHPIEIILPGDFQGNLPPGVVQRLQTLEEILTRNAADAEKMRQFTLEGLRIKAAAAGVDITEADITTGRAQLVLDAAQNAAKRAGLDADAARIGVAAAAIATGRAQLTLDEAELAAKRAGLDVTETMIAKERATVPPRPGLVLDTDPTTGLGEWVTPAVRERREADRARAVQRAQSNLALLSEAALLEAYHRRELSEAALYTEMRRRGFSDQEIRIAIANSAPAAAAGGAAPPPSPFG